LQFIEVRSAWGINILDLDAEQLATCGRRSLIMVWQCPASVADRQDRDRGGLRASPAARPACRRGRQPPRRRLHRIFSFFISDGSDPDDHRDEVLRRMTALAEVATDAGVIMLHENEKEIYGDITRRCLDIVTSVDSPNLKLACDPANFVQVGVRPFTDGYADLRPHVAYVQVKDALLADASVVVAGAGDGELVETVRALRADGFDGFFSLEPHLGAYTAFGALSGPELFTKAWQAFTDILKSEEIAYA
jgi:hypothetical protein